MEPYLQKLANDIGLDRVQLGQRKRFLELASDDVGRLQRVHALLDLEYPEFADRFYDHLLDFDDLRPLLADPATLAHLKQVQGVYFRSLTAGEYGDEYVHNRLRVGLVHQRIGLEPFWYLGAYRKYVSEMQALIWKHLQHDPSEFLKTCDALLKVVNFDISLALDTYFQADLEEIRHHRDYAERLVSSMPSGLMVVSAGLRVVSLNPAMRDMLRLDSSEEVVGEVLASVLRSPELVQLARQVVAQPECRRETTLDVWRDQTRHRIEFTLVSTVHRGKPLLLVLAQDNTRRFQAEQRLADNEALYRLTFDHAAVGLSHTAPDGRIVRINNKMCSILGFERQELLGKTFPQLAHPDDRASAASMVALVLEGELENYNCERRYMHKDGRVIWTNVTVSCLRQINDSMGLVVVMEDISQRKTMENELARLAGHDVLTGLPNRMLLMDRLSQSLAKARRANGQVAVIYIDLDRFKQINDSLGHAAGDAVLIEVSRRLVSVVRTADTVARLGGDEFVIVLDGPTSEYVVGKRARAILDVLSRPVVVQGHDLFTGGSVGLALYPKDGLEAETLLKNADAAMYRAKELGRNSFQFYTQAMNERSALRLRVANGLRQALERDELRVHYQPKFNATSAKLVGMEALVRWQPADQPLVSPADFIPVAEDTGLIIPIGDWVLRQACRQVVAWRALGHSHLRVAVNLSGCHFKNHDIVQTVASALRATQCPADALDLEITESILIESPEAITPKLRALSDLGVHLSIDDFGTGYSSLSYLRVFPIHELKIDRSFIQDIVHDESQAAIVRAIIGLAHNLRLSVIAEGVETPGQQAFLVQEGCDQLQGFLLGRPVSAADFEQQHLLRSV